MALTRQRLLPSIAICIALIVSLPQSAVSEAQSPAASTAWTILRSMQQKGVASLVEYVDWQRQYDALPPMQRRGTQGPEAMKQQYRELLGNPVAQLDEYVKTYVPQLPEAQRKEQEAEMKIARETILDTFKKLQKKLQHATFEVKPLRETATNAQLEVTLKDGSGSHPKLMNLAKMSDGRWLMSDLSFFMVSDDPSQQGSPTPPAAMSQ